MRPPFGRTTALVSALGVLAALGGCVPVPSPTMGALAPPEVVQIAVPDLPVPRSALPLSCEGLLPSALLAGLFDEAVFLTRDDYSPPNMPEDVVRANAGTATCLWTDGTGGVPFVPGLNITVRPDAEGDAFIFPGQSLPIGDTATFECSDAQFGCWAYVTIGRWSLDMNATFFNPIEVPSRDDLVARWVPLVEQVAGALADVEPLAPDWEVPESPAELICTEEGRTLAATALDASDPSSLRLSSAVSDENSDAELELAGAVFCDWKSDVRSMRILLIPGGGWARGGFSTDGTAFYPEEFREISVSGSDEAYVECREECRDATAFIGPDLIDVEYGFPGAAEDILRALMPALAAEYAP